MCIKTCFKGIHKKKFEVLSSKNSAIGLNPKIVCPRQEMGRFGGRFSVQPLPVMESR